MICDRCYYWIPNDAKDKIVGDYVCNHPESDFVWDEEEDKCPFSGPFEKHEEGKQF